jgi:hypothetical protein
MYELLISTPKLLKQIIGGEKYNIWSNFTRINAFLHDLLMFFKKSEIWPQYLKFWSNLSEKKFYSIEALA